MQQTATTFHNNNILFHDSYEMVDQTETLEFSENAANYFGFATSNALSSRTDWEYFRNELEYE